MTSPYAAVSVSGYNSNPPPDDGTTGANNKITWSGIKSKLSDPINTYAAAQNTALTTAFGKTLDGAGTATSAVDYPAGASDQGRLIIVTVSGKVVTTPDATVVLSPFVFGVLNQSTGNINITGNNPGVAQNVDGSTTQVLGPGQGCLVQTDGANWFTSGLKSQPSQGTTGNRPGSPAVGYTRYNTTLNVLEYWNGTRWFISLGTTRQYLLSGSSATYTTPAECRAIIVKMIGGGGGGGAQNTNNGSTGGTTTFNSITAIGGGGGVNAGSVGRLGGIGGTGGTGSASLRLQGSVGGAGASSASTSGGNGGPGIFGTGSGQGGPSGGSSAGTAGGVNTGAGGGGNSNVSNSAGGGGSGEYVEIVIASPAATYTYTVGTAGAGGIAGTQPGSAGGTGVIIVEEYY